MTWRIIHTTDGQHLGNILENIEKGQIVTFADGDVVPITEIFTGEDGTIFAISPNYQMKLKKE